MAEGKINNQLSDSSMKIAEVLDVARGWGRTIKTALLGLGVLLSSYFVPKLTLEHHEMAMANEQQPVAAVPIVSAAKGIAAPAALPSITFAVQSVGQSRTGKKFLNSTADYKSPSNQVVVLEGAAAAAVDVNAVKGRTITAFGQKGTYKGRPQLLVSNPANLQIQ